MSVPFLDLPAGIAPLRSEIDDAIKKVIDRGSFAGGVFVEKFEQEFASYCGTREAIGVGNGTDALWFALLASGVGPGDEVITVPNTFAATVEAILLTGAKPVFVDVEPASLNMNPDLVEAAITSRTKAIIPVHLFGQIARLEELLTIASIRKLLIIEDACQAHGATMTGRKAGSFGHAGCFSFYPGKNLGAFGEAGAIVTNDAEMARSIRSLRDHGQSRKYHHQFIGWNGRMDAIQAAVLSCKLPHLDQSNKARKAHATTYRELLASAQEVLLPQFGEPEAHVFHIFAVQIEERNACLADLESKGIHCGIHYPVPVHLQPAYRNLGYSEGDFPVAESAAKRLLSLPMFPELANAQISEVSDALITTAKRIAPGGRVLHAQMH